MRKKLLTLGIFLCAGASVTEAQVIDVRGTYTQNVAPNNIPWGGGQTPYHMTTIVEDGPALAMAVKRRPNAPNVIDNGNGTWTALAGHDVTNVNPNVTLWNVAFYIGSRNLSNFTYEFYYDFNPLSSTTVPELGGLDLPRSCNPTCFATLDETNLGFPNLNILGGNTFKLPNTPFDVNAVGEYTFALAAFSLNGDLADYVAIKVNTVSTVPEPGTYAFMASGLVALGIVRRSRRRKPA